uniref:Uncharacterized protein n=1 Tax=Glossina austeni TaxID=7395 RepID=A0A1A9VMV8_GLOAU
MPITRSRRKIELIRGDIRENDTKTTNLKRRSAAPELGHQLKEITNKNEMNEAAKIKKLQPEDMSAETTKNEGKNKRETAEPMNIDADVSPPKTQKLTEEENNEKGAIKKKNKSLAQISGNKCLEVSPKIENKSKSPKIKSISLKAQNNISSKTEAPNPVTSANNLPEQLLSVISNLYLNVAQRLHLDFTPRCLDDLAHCHRHHYRSDSPEMPSRNQAQGLRTAFEQLRYVTSINLTTDMCLRGEFPGAAIFKKLLELILSINYTSKQQPNITSQQCYNKYIELFLMIVRTFPPCWHKMRSYYIDFLDRGLDTSKLSSNKETLPSKSSKVCDILLDLLEDLLKKCPQSDLSFPGSDSINIPTFMEANGGPNLSGDISFSSECWNQNQYEEHERQLQTNVALTLVQRLERIFVALRLILHTLEYDLAMWVLHHNKNTKDWICSENRPLIVVMCELTQFTRMTRMARRIFTVFSEAVAKGLCKSRLQVLERYISLLMVASNTMDMENTAIGVKYPVLGEKTKDLIKDFFEIFKEHNREDITKYMENIELLHIPFVRYEFIDSVLFTNSEPLTPQKIALDMAKKRWLQHKIFAELEKPSEDISREQYLHLLLNALRSYCDWHGLKTFWDIVTKSVKITPLTTTNDSIHRWPTRGSGVLLLKKMAKDVNQLEAKLIMTVRMCKPKVDLPLADICIDETIIRKYRQDLKFVVGLHNVILKQKQEYPEVDFSEWLHFLNDFIPERGAAS